jgi:hypothetical protein
MFLPADVYFRVVNIAESYYVLLKRLKKIESSVLHGTAPPKNGQPHGNQISDTTASKAVKIINKQAECKRKIEAIEQSIKPLGPLYKDFIKLNFFEHRKAEEIELPMSSGDKQNVRRFFLTKLALNLNEI